MTREFDYITLSEMHPFLRLVFLIFAVFTFEACSSAPAARKHTHEVPLLPGMSSQIDPESVSEAKDKAINQDATEHEENDVADTILALERPRGSQKPDIKTEEAAADATTEAESENDIDLSPAPTARKHQIPFEFNQKVADWIRYFSQNDRERFQRFFDRGEPYREVIENILEENQVPVDLYYLGMIESGFSASAQSSAKAVGVWQFMRATGKQYGLSVDTYVDERRDPIRATEAAAKMMRDLYHEFHSWYLAMAAYNAGSGRIRQAIRLGKTNDFWELVEKRKLPKETMEYVPKFLAARYIGENPDLFAFYINEEKKYPNVELVKVPSPIPFASIEKSCGIPDGTLAFVNPQYLKTFTHPGRKFDEIWVPEDYQKKVEAKSRQLAGEVIRVKPLRVASEVKSRKGVLTYAVKRGDSLKSIAGRRGLSVAYLKRVNGLKSSKVSVGQRLKLSASSYKQKRSHPRTHKRKRSKR